MIRVVLPANLRTLAGVGREVELRVDGNVTQRSVLDALEAAYPMLRGTIRDSDSKRRRPLLKNTCSGVAADSGSSQLFFTLISMRTTSWFPATG